MFGSIYRFDEDDEQLSGPVFKRGSAVFMALTSNQGKALPRRTLILLDNAHRLDARRGAPRGPHGKPPASEVERELSSCSRSEVVRVHRRPEERLHE